MKKTVTYALLSVLSFGVGAGAASWFWTAGPHQPYSGQETREIAALSQSDIEELLAGGGWGLALPAELNGYPGPAHVLELAGDLDLTDDQVAKVKAIEAVMRASAKALGAEYVALERKLDQAFEAKDIDDVQLAMLTNEAGQLLSEIRNAHLRAHLEVTPLLSAEQIAVYNDKRGYGAGAGGHSGHGHH